MHRATLVLFLICASCNFGRSAWPTAIECATEPAGDAISATMGALLLPDRTARRDALKTAGIALGMQAIWCAAKAIANGSVSAVSRNSESSSDVIRERAQEFVNGETDQ